MTVGVRLFLSSMVFGLVIAVVYGVTTHEIVGTFLLAMMAVALFLIALFIRVAESEAHLNADVADYDPRDATGETVGVFALESYWPILAALSVVLVAAGITFLPGISLVLLISGGLLFAVTVGFMLREST